ncbi:MAG: hypothetical protein VKK04_16540 [Synechococcales bacterium]|nr:hypothetical protein [Synechococcales bacterium]
MHTKQAKNTSSWRSLASARIGRLCSSTAGIAALTVGLWATGLAGVVGQASQPPVESGAAPIPTAKTAIAPLSQPLPDGVYLYGQTSEPDQIGAVYMVFEVTGRQTVGALYMPHSSFDCFRGEFQADQLSLMVRATYEQEVFPYAVPLDTTAPVASASGEGVTVSLVGFQPLDTVSSNDERILSTCKAETWE